MIATHLMQLLCKDAFAWIPKAVDAFTALKCALSTGLVLQMLDFDRQFVIKCDASDTNFGAVLHQEAEPWHSSAGHSLLATTSWWCMSRSSSAWSKPCTTSGRTSRVVASSSAPTTIA